MNFFSRISSTILLLAFIVSLPLSAKKTVDATESYPLQVLEGITPTYTQWESVELNGKLHMDKLPITPKARIYMKRGEVIDISVRASFLGEVGRIRITPDSIMAVNKMKKVYCCESIGLVTDRLPGALSELQTILLGRVNVFGNGELSADNIENLNIAIPGQDLYGTEIDPTDPDSPAWELTGVMEIDDNDDLEYDYIIFRDGRVNAVDMKVEAADMELAMASAYSKNERKMVIMYAKDNKVKFETMLTLESPRWDVAEPAPFSLNSKYRQLTLSQFLRSF